LGIVKEEQRRRRRHFAAILRTDGQLRPISALQLVDDAYASPSSPRLDLARKSHLRH
jgi:hypothetical protein